jgi:TonB-dependent receptor
MHMHYPYPSPASAGFRHTLLALCLAGALSPVQAADTTLQTIVVHGQAESLNNALDLQQAADNIVSAVSADDIGQLPDTNAAEALQRVPGVTLERDQGEGRYVRVRGAGPDLNSVTINGTLVPAPESERRAVALDVIPAALIRSLEVSKTQTPDQDGNALGGSVEVKTLSAFDHPGRFARVDVEGSYDDNAGKTSPKLAAAVSDRFADGKLGVAAGISLEQREFGSDNVETGGAWKFKSQAQLEEFEQRRYDITRERLGGALNLDYRPDSKQSYYLRSLASRFSDEEERQAHAIEFAKAQAEGVPGSVDKGFAVAPGRVLLPAKARRAQNSGLFQRAATPDGCKNRPGPQGFPALGPAPASQTACGDHSTARFASWIRPQSGETRSVKPLSTEPSKAESARELKSRKETQDIMSLVLGSEQQLGDWKLDLALASSKASEDTPEHIAGAVFKSNDDFSKVGFGDTRKPELLGPDSMYDPAQFTLDEVEQVKQQTEDREHNLRFDLGRSLQLAGMPLEMKFGAKFSRRKKTNDSEVWQYEDLDNAPSLAASTDGEVSYGLGRFGPRISRGAVQGFIDGLNRGDYYNEEESRVNDFTLHEDINAGYLQGTLKPGCGAFSAACVTKAPASAPAAPGSTMARLSPTR